MYMYMYMYMYVYPKRTKSTARLIQERGSTSILLRERALRTHTSNGVTLAVKTRQQEVSESHRWTALE